MKKKHLFFKVSLDSRRDDAVIPRRYVPLLTSEFTDYTTTRYRYLVCRVFRSMRGQEEDKHR